ncbi:hypothetical protein [Pseudarthrobacter sp. NS4]|uniref:hypothetical protein n=1 Tax=Pseudarthrobacter sp. NS4 TaxID=2973976 RepID=UPI0021632C79|nr:hypothetical protein [Pseudarthrobacter sp. NS4]
MSEKDPRTENLPTDDHLREDISAAPAEEQAPLPDKDFTPGQTNAGQQVAGLASAAGYGEHQDPEEQDGNHPV